jgi:hypothetical protein
VGTLQRRPVGRSIADGCEALKELASACHLDASTDPGNARVSHIKATAIRLVRLRAGEPYDFGPFLGLVGNEPPEIAG